MDWSFFILSCFFFFFWFSSFKLLYFVFISVNHFQATFAIIAALMKVCINHLQQSVLQNPITGWVIIMRLSDNPIIFLFKEFNGQTFWLIFKKGESHSFCFCNPGLFLVWSYLFDRYSLILGSIIFFLSIFISNKHSHSE